MGTWDDGLLDNDTALDGLGDLRSGIAEDIVGLGAAKPTAANVGKLAAAVGVLLQLSSYEFRADTESGPKIAGAVKAHATAIAKLPAAARKVLAQVAAGEGSSLAERPAKMPARTIGLLTVGGKKAPFGKREAALFASPAAAGYVQGVARRCIEALDEDFEDEDTWSDLCREAVGMGGLAVLLVLEPCKVPLAKVRRWRKAAKAGIASLEAEPDDEIDFHRGYYAKLDAVLALLEKRFA